MSHHNIEYIKERLSMKSHPKLTLPGSYYDIDDKHSQLFLLSKQERREGEEKKDSTILNGKKEQTVLRIHRSRQNQVWYFLRGVPVLLAEVVVGNGNENVLSESCNIVNGDLRSFLEIPNTKSKIRFTVLGPHISNGQVLHHSVKPGTWVTAAILLNDDEQSECNFSLVGRTVFPLTFSDNDDFDVDLDLLNNSDGEEKSLFQLFSEKEENDSSAVQFEKAIPFLCKIETLSNSLSANYNIHKPKALQQKHPQFRTTPFENPHQILISLIIFVCVLPLALFRDTSTSTQDDDIRIAILTLFISFLAFTFLQTRDLILTTPHPGVWRLIFGVVSFYTLFMLALLMLGKESARHVIRIIFRDIGTLEEFETQIQERIDAVMGTCTFSYGALMRQLFHCPWFLSHLLGWAGKMIMFRDYYLAMIAAIMFEICEVTFMYVVPEFEECWWDSLFLDTLGANLLGMILGGQVNKWISNQRLGGKKKEMKDAETDTAPPTNTDVGAEFNWCGKEERLTTTSRLLMYVSPFTTRYQWKIFSSPSRMIRVLVVAFFMVLVDLNHFLIINSFGIPNASLFPVLRLLFIGLLAVPASSEWYAYIEECDKFHGKMGIRFGPSIWILFCVVIVECAVVFKFFPKHMSTEIEKVGNPMGVPYGVLIPHLLSLSLILLWAVLRYKVIGYTIDLSCNQEKDIVQKLVDDSSKQVNEKKLSPSRWFCKFRQLPSAVKRKVLMIELVDIILVLASLPMCYLFYVGWKWT